MSDPTTKPGNKCPGGLACGEGCPYGPCRDCTRTTPGLPKSGTSLGRLDTDGSISFSELAKDCPAQNTSNKCTIRVVIGAYFTVKCKESMCPIWHFTKAMMVQKDNVAVSLPAPKLLGTNRASSGLATRLVNWKSSFNAHY